jgi:hypothetical protein
VRTSFCSEFFLLYLGLSIQIYKLLCFEENWSLNARNTRTCVETRRAQCQAALLVSNWLTALSCGFFIIMQPMKTIGSKLKHYWLRGSLIVLGHFQAYLHWVLNTLGAFLKLSQTHFIGTVKREFYHFSSVSKYEMGISCTFSLKANCSCLLKWQIYHLTDKLRNNQRFLSKFFNPNHTPVG